MRPSPDSYRYYTIMRQSKDPKYIRLEMVRYASEHGVKPAARFFGTSPQTVRKWLRRWQPGTLNGLEDLSRSPHSCPHKISADVEQRIVSLKKKLSTWGAERLKRDFKLSCSEKAIRRVYKEYGLIRKRRTRKRKKNDLRAVKMRFRPFEKALTDTKYLTDIPEYLKDQRLLKLPTHQYTWRDVKSGLQFLAYGSELSGTYATLFAGVIIEHLQRYNVDLSNTTWQTDNGSEFIGSWQAQKQSAFTKCIESVQGQKHHTIPPGAHTWQSDIETVHNLIENEFFVIENFNNRKDFFKKAATYQLFFNVARPNSSKGNRTPWDILVEDLHNPDPYIPLLPPIDLDLLLANKDPTNIFQGGNHVRSYPFSGK